VGTNEKFHKTRLAEAFSDDINSAQFREDWKGNYAALIADKPIPLLTGVQDLLEWLQASEIICAVATSTAAKTAEQKLEASGIRHFFSTVTGGDQVENSKPSPEIYLKAARSVNANPVNSLALEDSHNGVIAAVAAGMHVVQVPNLVPPSEELLKQKHRVCASLHEVLALVKTGFPTSN